MKGVFLVVALFLVTLVYCEQSSHVVVLNDANFEESVAKGVWLVKLYAPWCGHCKRLAPTWEQLATTVRGRFNVAKVDCTVDQAICKKQGARGFPTINLIVDGGSPKTYSGSRDANSFISFVEQNAQIPAQGAVPIETPAVQPSEEPKPQEPVAVEVTGSGVVILTDKNFEEQIKTGTWLVEFYAPWCGHCKRLVPLWEDLAASQAQQQLFKVAKTDSTVEREIASKYKVYGFPTIKLFHNGKFVADYKGERTIEKFTQFVSSHLEKLSAQ